MRVKGDEFWHMTKVLRLGIDDRYGFCSDIFNLSCILGIISTILMHWRFEIGLYDKQATRSLLVFHFSPLFFTCIKT